MRDCDLIKREIEKSGLSQAEVAKGIGLCRSELNRYLNGHRQLTQDLAQRIAAVIDSPILIKKFFRTTSSDIVFDIEYSNLYEILSKTEIELEELRQAIQETKNELVNTGHKNNMTRKQIKVCKHLLQQNEDVNQATDIVDIAMKHRGFDLQERNRKFKDRCQKKYKLITTRNEAQTAYV